MDHSRKRKLSSSSPFKNIDNKYSKLFKIHFDQRFETEHKFFKDSGNVASKNISNIIKIKSEDLKNDKLLNLIKMRQLTF